MTKLIINCETGETEERELNAEELAQEVIDNAKSEAIEAERLAKATAKADLLEKLGITQEEAELLLG